MQASSSEGCWVPKSDLVAANAPLVKADLKELISSTTGEFNVNLSEVSMIDSKGLGLLIAAVNSLDRQGRRLRVSGANDDLIELFKMMRLDRHLTIA